LIGSIPEKQSSQDALAGYGPATFKLMGLDLAIQAEQNETIKLWNLMPRLKTAGNVSQCAIRQVCGKRAKKLTVGVTVSFHFEFELVSSTWRSLVGFYFRCEKHSTKSCDLWQWENRLFTLKCIIFKIDVCLIESFVA
jgi:hypothetical protein